MQLELGKKLRQLRCRDGRTQETLAAALGVTPQAVSRWESGGGYPDMNLIPAIANYFGITIDELFGYHNERAKKVDALVAEIRERNGRNNGVDMDIDECIAMAREAMAEFPGNEKIMLCLASVLYNTGYVRHGEYHLTDEEGYAIYDVERHRGYGEWREAISLYEKLLGTLEAGELRNQAVRELTQLYRNTGEYERAMAVIESVPDLYGSRELLRINACDGKAHVKANAEALLKTVRACAELMIGGVIASGQNMTPGEKSQSIRGAIGLFEQVCPDGNFGFDASFVARMYTLLSLYLWLENKRDEAFGVLDKARLHFEMFEEICEDEEACYTAPLVRLVKIKEIRESAGNGECPQIDAVSLAEDWPWWQVPEAARVKKEMQEDPRWGEWSGKLRA